ncbi:MAG: hypothetical protein ACI4AD_11885 [Roseburia sp.]
MKCKNCGAEIGNEVRVCPYCDTEVDLCKDRECQVEEMDTKTAVAEKEPEKSNVSADSLYGKKYEFSSSRGANLAGIFNSKICSTVEVREDRLLINITPKRMNTAPAVFLEDITGIDISAKINLYYWLWIIISAIGGIFAPWLFIATALFVFCGLDRKITISQRNGVRVVMYAQTKSEAEGFKEDMKKITKIQ